ncbi:hypothetical protein LB507_000225 [Fusarium sp. FIESC RH6]|nr:hypothetical protein LB507_000225 [Fusarium sp. FIESC RH6]
MCYFPAFGPIRSLRALLAWIVCPFARRICTFVPVCNCACACAWT